MIVITTRAIELNNYNNLIVILVTHVTQKHVVYRRKMGYLFRRYYYMGDEG